MNVTILDRFYDTRPLPNILLYRTTWTVCDEDVYLRKFSSSIITYILHEGASSENIIIII